MPCQHHFLSTWHPVDLALRRQPPLIASRYYYDVFNGTTKVLDNLRATVSPVANQTNRLQFTTGTLPTQWRYRVVVRATTGQGAVYNTASQASSNLAGVGELQLGHSWLACSGCWSAGATHDFRGPAAIEACLQCYKALCA